MKVERTLAVCVLLLAVWATLACVSVYGKFVNSAKSGLNRTSNEAERPRQRVEFWDHQGEHIPANITGEKAELIKRNMAALFVPCSVRERKRAEKVLIELVSTYEVLENSVEAEATWSSPLSFAPSPNRRAIVAFLHSGTGCYVSLWALCEFTGGVKCFRFTGSGKGCGFWQVCKDLDGDGSAEIVVKHFVGSYDGADTVAVWPAIYKWNGNFYVRADKEFPAYYAQKVVPDYRRIVQEHKDWRDQTNRDVRRIYEKCQFILERAESIVKKPNAKP